ncbi:hypothetical protein MA16_Dca020728 [Dendrobium catenatum]|uniref:Uncharacterized protein n=1 Tax=Dendrobium catenatum TaxID=906689 RepID=A0A2I0X7E8_9ASPA|nr:hypothetical protein MA16_Dca020728 [Dendrobium catenatum]
MGLLDQKLHHLALKADGGGIDDVFDQDPIVPLSQAIVVPGLLRLDATKERIDSGHNRDLVVPFGSRTTRFRGPQVKRKVGQGSIGLEAGLVVDPESGGNRDGSGMEFESQEVRRRSYSLVGSEGRVGSSDGSPNGLVVGKRSEDLRKVANGGEELKARSHLPFIDQVQQCRGD